MIYPKQPRLIQHFAISKRTINQPSVNVFSDENISHDGRRILSNSSEFLIETLDYLLKKNHDPEDLTMSKVIQIISDCKELEPVFRATHHNMIEDAAGLQLPQIYLDLFTN